MTAKLHRTARCTAAVLAVIAVGAGATACDSSPSPKASTDSGAAKDSSSDQQGGSQDGTEAASGVNVKKTAQQGSRTDAVNTAASSASSRCHTGDLGYSWGGPHGGRPDMDADNQQVASIRLTNKGESTCTLRGFPGVRMISESGEAWDLSRSSDKPSTITLRPGASTAAISMNILPVPEDIKDTKPFVPSKVLITPPNETSHVTLDWPYGGAFLDQSGATRPGTFVNPVGVG